MLLLNKGYQWKIDSNSTPNGVVLNASSMLYGQLTRRVSNKKNALNGIKTIFFDPQLHLFQSNSVNFKKLNNTLSTYPWFDLKTLDYKSTTINLNEYRNSILNSNTTSNISNENNIEEKIKSCFDFQNTIKTTGLIAPAPLILNVNSDISIYLNWLNTAIDVYKKHNYKKDLYLSINLTEEILTSQVLEKNFLFQNLLDNLTALDSCISGFYITISRNKNTHYICEKNIIKALFELSYILGMQLGKKIIINSTDVLGFLCLSLGATYFATGYSNKEKRLNFEDYIDKDSSGGALPRFYSHSLLNDFFPYRDLIKINNLNLLNLIESDKTHSSTPLFSSLKNKQQISTWKEGKNNTSSAINHKIQLLNQKTNELNCLAEDEKVKHILNWLIDAERNMIYLNTRLGKNSLSKTGTHISIWREVFEEFVRENCLI